MLLRAGTASIQRRSFRLHPAATLAHTDSDTIYDRIFSLTHLSSTIHLSPTVDAKEQSTRASPTNCSFQSKTQERTELTCTSHSSSYNTPHYTRTSQTCTLDTLSISLSSPFLSILGCAGMPPRQVLRSHKSSTASISLGYLRESERVREGGSKRGRDGTCHSIS